MPATTLKLDYDDVGKIVFDVTTHMRGGAIAQVVSAAPLAGPMVGAAVAGAHVSNYWFYLQYRDHEHDESILIDVPKDYSAQVTSKAKSVFGARVTVNGFPRKRYRGQQGGP